LGKSIICVKCGNEAEGNNWIDLKDGTFLCANCINEAYNNFNFRKYIKENKKQYRGLFKLVRIVRKLLASDRDSIIAVSSVEGEGKTQKAGSKVLMTNGEWKVIEDIKIGDEVLSPQYDCSYVTAKVVGTHSRWENDMYDIVSLKNENKVLYTCAGNHDIPIINNINGSFYNVEAKDLKTGVSMKYNPKWKIKKFKYVPIKIVHSSPGMVYGFELDSQSKLYITDNMMVTHNSTIIENMMAIQDKKFDVERNTIFMPNEEEVKEKMISLPRFSAISLDEAMKVLYKRGWQSKERRQLNILFSTCRKRNLGFYFAIPNFWDLDSYYREHRVKLWIFIPVRGYAMVLVRDDNPYAEDPWHRKQNQTIINKASRYGIIMEKNQLISTIRKVKNCKYEFTFPDLPEPVKHKYLLLTKIKTIEYENEGSEEKLSDKAKIYQERMKDAIAKLVIKGFTRKELSEMFGYSLPQIATIIRDKKVRRTDIKYKLYNKDIYKEKPKEKKEKKEKEEEDSGENISVVDKDKKDGKESDFIKSVLG